MIKRVILSTNNNPDYFFYLPIVEWVWIKMGWWVDVFYTNDCQGLKTMSDKTGLHLIPRIDNVRTGTCAQVVRHFASNNFHDDDYLMVQDIDLIPLRAWDPDLTKSTIYGWELTGRSFIPVHYTGMTSGKWKSLMGCTGDLKADMEREMKVNGRAYGKEWSEYWDTDWDILTQKVTAQKGKFTFVDRGMVSLGKYQTARGRVDRCSIEVAPDGSYSWGYTLNQPDLIDAHCENNNPSSPEKWAMIRALLIQVFKEIPIWMDDYVLKHHNKYRK